MADWHLKTPIVFIIFNRPDTTARVFEVIRQARAPQLLVIADGPRPDRPGEAEMCAAARSVIERVDWPCEVLKNYAEANLGCGRRPATGITWAFEQVEQAIILEDDCIPHPSFFRFCEELLEHYQYDERVMHISGNNFQFGRRRTGDSYYFSRYNHIWGWATWRRAWRHFDYDMELWPMVRDGGWLCDVLLDQEAVRYWNGRFQLVHDGGHDVWDYRWTFACWVQNGLSILPNVNLVSNIGFGSVGTHTTQSGSRFSNLSVQPMEFPLRHPSVVIRDAQADAFTQATNFSSASRPTLKVRAERKLKRILKSALRKDSARAEQTTLEKKPEVT